MPRAAMKVHPLNLSAAEGGKMANERSTMVKTKLRRIFERQFQSVSKNTAAETPDPRPPGESSSKNIRIPAACNLPPEAAGIDHEPNSVSLAEMVHDFLENGEKESDWCRTRCNCLYGHFSADKYPDSEDDRKSSLFSGEVGEILKSLVPCPSLMERNLLADTSKSVDEANTEAGITLCKDKDVCTNGCLRRAVVRRLRSKGYNAAVCKTKWDQANRYPSGEYQYIDVLEGGGGKAKAERIIIDIDFRSQFEIARSTSHYNSVLQMLPAIFVGRADRLQQIINLVCDAARQSLKKKHLHIPPWRRFEYMQAKWLSENKRIITDEEEDNTGDDYLPELGGETRSPTTTQVASIAVKGSGWGTKFTSEFELEFRAGGNGILRQPPAREDKRAPAAAAAAGSSSSSGIIKNSVGLGHSSSASDQITVVVSEWEPPAVKPKSVQRGGKIAAGLASMLREAGLSTKS